MSIVRQGVGHTVYEFTNRRTTKRLLKMGTKEGQDQDDAVESGKASESPLTDLLHGFQDHHKNPGKARFKTTPSPLLIANLFLSIVLLVTIYKMGVQGIGLREKVEELTEDTRELASTLESIQRGVPESSQELDSESASPSQATSEKTGDEDHPVTQQGQSEPPISSRSAPRKPREVKRYVPHGLSKTSKVLYRVKDGDTLSRLSNKFGVSVEQICTWNSIEPTDPLLAERVLIIYKTMAMDTVQVVAGVGSTHEADQIESEGRATTGESADLSEIEPSGSSSFVSEEVALEEISEAKAQAEAAKQAVSELQVRLDAEHQRLEQTVARLEEEAKKREELEAKLAADYLSKETAALAQVSEAKAQAETANQAVSGLQARLDTERQELEEAVARLEEEAKKREELEAKLADEYLSKETALYQIDQAKAQAEAANQAVSELQVRLDAERQGREQIVARLEEEAKKREELEAKLAADSLAKETALAQISEARAQAEAANQAVSELQVRLDAERQGREQTVARLEEEAKKREDLEKEYLAEEPRSSQDETREERVTIKQTMAEKAPESAPKEGQEPVTGKPARETVHVIRAGENLFRIGIKYGVSWKTLVKYNNLTDANAIYVGQKIRIPMPEKSDPKATPPDER